MKVTPDDLLRVLGSGVRPGQGTEAAAGGAVTGFAQMLEQARAGVLRTDLPVSVASGADVELDEQTLGKLAEIVDRAHAAGATRVVVLHGNVALDVDVLSRRVLGRVDLTDENIGTGFDGIVRLAPDRAAKALPLPPVNAANPSLLDALARDDEQPSDHTSAA